MATATATATVTAGACCGFLLLLLHLHLAAADDKLLVYRLVLHTFWSRDRFPKHFPDWRPPAQWSAVVGRSHDQHSSLFRLGAPASPGLRRFAETGQADVLDAALPQAGDSVLDQFKAPPIPTGVGRTEVHFFADSNHSKVSAISHITPSPDWFIGIDSFDLFVGGTWIDSITLEADPLDAGTDNGFTFTAPNWRTEPPGPVYRITSRHPSHPACSFYYPQLPRLPPLATFQIIKLREYNLGTTFNHSQDDLRYELLQTKQVGRPAPEPINNNDIENEIEQERLEQPFNRDSSTTTTTTTVATTTSTTTEASTMAAIPFNTTALPEPPRVIPRGNKDAIRNHIRRWNKNNKKLPRKKFRAGIRDCRVGEWAAWGPCSQSCGIGEMHRHRPVLKEAGRRGGRACPPLTETRWCGSARTCERQNYFEW